MKQGTSLSRTRRYEQGASLVIVVLLAMIVLAGLVVMSSNLALSARRTTTEQKSIIPAQFAAESGVAYAKAKLDAGQALITASDGPPSGYKMTQMNTLVGQLCPTAATLPLTNYSTLAKAITVPGTTIPVTGVVVCDFPDKAGLTGNQLNFFTTIINGGSKSGPIYAKYSINPLDSAKFFNDLFSYSNSVSFGDAKVSSGLQPIALVETGSSQYKFYFKIADLNSTGISGDSARTINAASNSNIHDILINYEERKTVKKSDPTNEKHINFASYGMFVNNSTGDAGYYDSNNYFSGPVHSNSRFPFGYSSTDSYGKPIIGQSVIMDAAFTSAGCNSVSYSSTEGKDVCDGGTSDNYSLTDKTLESDDPDKTVILHGSNVKASAKASQYAGYTDYTDGKMKFSVKTGNKAPEFKSNFVPMPLNAKDQGEQATKGGISIDGDVSQISLVAGKTDNFQYLTITPKDKNGKILSKVEYRYTPSADKSKMLMDIKVNGVWKPARKAQTGESSTAIGWVPAKDDKSDQGNFNGVVYASGNIDSLSGPLRNNSKDTTATGGAAISKFAAITVAAEGNVTVTGDIKYETPCSSATACVNPTDNTKRTADNIFGVYSGGGDIRVAYDPTTPFQQTDPTKTLNAPSNLQIDGFVMAAKNRVTGVGGQIRPWNAKYPKDATKAPGSYGNRGDIIVHGGIIKDTDALFNYRQSGYSHGWDENYIYDGRGTNYAPPAFPTTDIQITTTTSPDEVIYTGEVNPDTFAVGLSKVDASGNEVTCTSATGTYNCADFTFDHEIRQGTLNSAQ